MDSGHMNIVFVGHVDHGKSTIVGRLLADTNALPKGKLEALQESCARSGKPFEYAFLIDALKDERAQNITIDTARIFFKSKKREYLILDAPGHIEFIRNMVTGASHAEAAVLVIDANEGVMENSRRHGRLLSLLGIRRIIVAINKMDLVAYSPEVFERVRDEYAAFLQGIGVQPAAFIPLSGREGEGVAHPAKALPWYKGPTILEALDAFEKDAPPANQPLRLPIQGVYRFQGNGDRRRIIAGSIASGTLNQGDALVAYPSGKKTSVESLVGFNRPDFTQAGAGEAIGLTMREQVYLRRGELLSKHGEPAPQVSTRLRVSLFWIGQEPLVMGKQYLLKLGTARQKAELESIESVMDATSYAPHDKPTQVAYHEVAELILRLEQPIAFDASDELPETSRFVLVDGYEIAGGGIVREGLVDSGSSLRREVYQRSEKWIHGRLSSEDRAARFDQEPALIVITGPRGSGRKRLAAEMELQYFEQGRLVYYLGIGSVLYGVNADLMEERDPAHWQEHLRRFGEVCHLLLDTGMILIVTAVELTQHDVDSLRIIVGLEDLRVIWVGGPVTTDLVPDEVVDHF